MSSIWTCDICNKTYNTDDKSACDHNIYISPTIKSGIAIAHELGIENYKPYGEQGIKNDTGKAQLSLLTRESLEYEAAAFEYGARKYDRNNYKKGMNWTRILDAMLRHITAFNSKEDLDPESGLNHLAHAKACIAMLIYYYENKVGTDDR